MGSSLRYRVVAVAACLGSTTAASAQTSPYVEYWGMTAAIGAERVELRIPGASRQGKTALGLAAGYRMHLPRCVGLRGLSFTPQVSLLATHILGIDDAGTDTAFAAVDRSIQVAYAFKRVRPFLTFRSGLRKLERDDGGVFGISNYQGKGTGWTTGVEIPLLVRSGHGLTVSYSTMKGEFSKIERRGDETPTLLPYRATVIAIAWSGRFRGTFDYK